jgi:hypothetical protein
MVQLPLVKEMRSWNIALLRDRDVPGRNTDREAGGQGDRKALKQHDALD